MGTLETLADQTGSTRAQIVGIGEKSLSFNLMTNAAQTMIDELDGINGYHPEINFRVAAAHMNAGQAILFEADYDEAAKQLRDDIYLDFCRENGMPYGCQSVLLREPGHMIGFALLRNERDGKTTEEVRDCFALAEKAARISVRMQLALEKQGLSILNGTLDDMSVNCILLDRDGRIGSMTAGAEDHLAGRGAILRADGGWLRGRTQADTRAIEHTLAQLITGNMSHRRLLLTPDRDADFWDDEGEDNWARPFRVDFFRLRHREWAFGFVPAVAVIIRPHGLRCCNGADAHLLSLAFGLTGAEAAVACLLATGVTRPQIMAIRGISNETLRVQIKNIYGKTGCNREAELVLLLANVLS